MCIASADPPLTVSFIDVLQDDSILIHGDGNQNIPLNGGWTYMSETATDHFRALGIDDVDVKLMSAIFRR